MKIQNITKHYYKLAYLFYTAFVINSCSINTKTQTKLKHFVPQTDSHGNILISKTGDTIWHKVPSFNFIDENGNTVTEAIMKDNIVIADFFFTTCPSICISMSQNLGMIQEYFKNKNDIKILSHTVNPEGDTPEVLKAYSENHNADPNKWKFLTGTKKDLYNQARKGYFITAIDGNGDTNDFIHSEKIVLIDKNKNIRGFFRGTVKEDITKLIESIEILSLEYQAD